MAFTLSDLIRGAIRKQGIDAFDIRIATAGSTIMFEDTTLEDKYGDDELKDGTILVTKTAAGIAPQGEFARITAYSEGAMQASFAALTDAIAAGDSCMLISPEYPLRFLIELANEAIVDCGMVSMVDENTTTVANVTEYDLAPTLKNVVAVYVQTDTDTDDNHWKKVVGWRVVPSDGNVATKLVFFDSFSAGYKLQIVYNAFHSRIDAYNSPINEQIPEPLVTLFLADKIMEWHGVTDENRNSANKIQSELEDAKRMFPVKRIMKTMNVLTVGANG